LTVNSGHSGWSDIEIMQFDPAFGPDVLALLQTLQVHGLIAARVSTRPTGGGGQYFYGVTGLGQEFLARLADDSR